MSHQLFLLRHGEVASHRGDVPVTDDGLQTAVEVGRRLAARAEGGLIRVISGATRRTRETAAAVVKGAREAGAQVQDDGVAFALRNPDLYLAGSRVDMVSSEADFAAQVPGLSEADVARIDFYAQWLQVPDRVGWWVRHENPPGDDAAAVARRINAFAASLADREDNTVFTVAVTHSPVLRAVAREALGEEPGEPQWLAGLEVEVTKDRTVRIKSLPEAP
jgi:broad specificity phosphatase PhoE